jgi:rhodanese-related sulfurtransferase
MTENEGSGRASISKEVISQIAMIAREEILARLNAPSLLLVNVMPKETFADGHIPHSINLPLSEVKTKSHQLFPDIGRELVVYCGGPS